MINQIYNESLIKKAKEFAFNLHQSHNCIFTGIEKSQHLTDVVKQIKNLNMNNNIIIILAYLHDTLDYVPEDARAKLLDDIKETFSEHIAKLVVEVADFFKIEDISTPTGKAAFVRRMVQIKSPSGISDEAAMVILAEKVCNLLAMQESIEKKGFDYYWEDFSNTHHLNKDDVKEYYEEIYSVLQFRCYDNLRLRPLVDKYDDLIFRIFDR